MKRVIVTSDSHGCVRTLEEAFRQALRDGPIHTAVFLGDGVSDFEALMPMLQEKGTRCILVPGNNDWSCTEQQEKVFAVGRVLFFACHGHTRHVRYSMDRLSYAASERMARVALYGHTHRARLEEDGGMYLINPGAICEKHPGATAYAEILVDEEGRIFPKLVEWQPD